MRTPDFRQESLFSKNNEMPLAKKMQPTVFEEFLGQKHFVNEEFIKIIKSDKWLGFIFWGPPGTGKTSLAALIAKQTMRIYFQLSAVSATVKEIRSILEKSKDNVISGLKAFVVFIDEVHRLNKAQQDVLLPYLENGYIRFIGATTENPSFEINNAISSRVSIHHFEPLKNEDIVTLLKRTSNTISESVLEKIASASLGDARRALNLLENLILSTNNEISEESFQKLAQSQTLYYDKKSESHYDTISAFIKSIRGSDPDAAVYYLARMIEGGEDPLFIARRLVILASEDIGNANPMALVLATSAFQAVHAIGMPEARIILAQATTYLSCSEKSNRSYLAINEAIQEVKKTGNLKIPLSILNAPTKLMKEWGYGANYMYPHDFEEAWVNAQYLPDEIKDKRFYKPSNIGKEQKFQDFLNKRKT